MRQTNEVDELLIVELVKRERLLQPKLGGRKLIERLRDELLEDHIEIGRDRFFDVLRKHDLLSTSSTRRVQRFFYV